MFNCYHFFRRTLRSLESSYHIILYQADWLWEVRLGCSVGQRRQRDEVKLQAERQTCRLQRCIVGKPRAIESSRDKEVEDTDEQEQGLAWSLAGRPAPRPLRAESLLFCWEVECDEQAERCVTGLMQRGAAGQHSFTTVRLLHFIYWQMTNQEMQQERKNPTNSVRLTFMLFLCWIWNSPGLDDDASWGKEIIVYVNS